jgi:hypothetical protein
MLLEVNLYDDKIICTKRKNEYMSLYFFFIDPIINFLIIYLQQYI